MEFSPHLFPPKPKPNWREDCKIFMRMTPIKKEDLIHGRNSIEHLTADEFFGKTTSKTAFDEKIYKFGKYRGKTYEWVKTNDPSYYEWCILNVRGFKE
jgi:hypothetical protein